MTAQSAVRPSLESLLHSSFPYLWIDINMERIMRFHVQNGFLYIGCTAFSSRTMCGLNITSRTRNTYIGWAAPLLYLPRQTRSDFGRSQMASSENESMAEKQYSPCFCSGAVKGNRHIRCTVVTAFCFWSSFCLAFGQCASPSAVRSDLQSKKFT